MSPQFPQNVFPQYMEQYLDAVCENVQVTREQIGPMALIGLSASCIGKGVVCLPNGHEERLALYILIISAPGTRKSATMDLLINDPIRIVEHITGKTIAVTDATPESLLQSMERNGGQLCVVSAEGGILNKLCGQTYGKAPNLDALLQSYDGETIAQKRITREGQHLQHPELTIGIAVQPSVAQEFIRNKYYRDVGLTARFLYSQPPSLLGSRTWDSDPIPETVASTYLERTVEMLTAETPNEPKRIYISTEAAIEIRCFFNELESVALDNPHYDSDGSARSVATAERIAGLLHIAERTATDEITGDEMARAIKITRFFRSTAENLFGEEAFRPSDDVMYVLRKFRDLGFIQCTFPILHSHCRRRFNRADNLKGVLKKAESMGYIRTETIPSAKGGPSTTSISVNPLVFLD